MPLGCERLVTCRDCGRHLGIPSGEGVALAGGYGSRQSRGVVLCRHHVLLTIAQHKRHRVLVDLPLGRERLVTCRDCSRHLCIPSCEGVALATGYGSRQSSGIVLCRHHVILAIAQHERHRVLVRSELGREFNVLGRHELVGICHRLVRPFHKMITLFGRGRDNNLTACLIRIAATYGTHRLIARGSDRVVDNRQRERTAGHADDLLRLEGNRFHVDVHLLGNRFLVHLERDGFATCLVAAYAQIAVRHLLAVLLVGPDSHHATALVATESGHLVVGIVRDFNTVNVQNHVSRHVVLVVIDVDRPVSVLCVYPQRKYTAQNHH